MSSSTRHASSGARVPASADERPTAVVYCEANFGRLDGKTANGLVRSSERYEIVATGRPALAYVEFHIDEAGNVVRRRPLCE